MLNLCDDNRCSLSVCLSVGLSFFLVHIHVHVKQHMHKTLNLCLSLLHSHLFSRYLSFHSPPLSASLSLPISLLFSFPYLLSHYLCVLSSNLASIFLSIPLSMTPLSNQLHALSHFILVIPPPMSRLLLLSHSIIFEKERNLFTSYFSVNKGNSSSPPASPIMFSVDMLTLGQIIQNSNISFHCYRDDRRLYLPLKQSHRCYLNHLMHCLKNIKGLMAQNFLQMIIKQG